jgi:hypothetical protein
MKEFVSRLLYRGKIDLPSSDKEKKHPKKSEEAI